VALIRIKEREPVESGSYIYFELPRPAKQVWVDIYDVAGRRIRRYKLVNLAAGMHSVYWDGRNDLGERVAWGVYYVTITADTLRYTSPIIPGRCLEDAIAAGYTLEEAVRRCGLDRSAYEEFINDLELKHCIEEQIRAGASWNDAVGFCRYYAPPPSEEEEEEEKEKEEEERPLGKVPTWAWIVIGLLGFMIVTGGRR